MIPEVILTVTEFQDLNFSRSWIEPGPFCRVIALIPFAQSPSPYGKDRFDFLAAAWKADISHGQLRRSVAGSSTETDNFLY